MSAARLRVISDNDYGGDPDGLVQLAHLLLSPSVEVPFVLSSHLRVDDPFDPSGRSAANGAAKAATVAELCGRGEVPIVAGAEVGLVDRATPVDSESARRIVVEAMREDSHLPLFVTCGGGLTEIASAYLLEPAIADRLTVVWIGGGEYPDLHHPLPGGEGLEYNQRIDPIAAQVVFEDSELDLWQVPRPTYRQTIVSFAELATRMRGVGALGTHLHDAPIAVVEMATAHGLSLGETYVMGDNPLVLLTALWTSFEPGPASCEWVVRPCPGLTTDGGYTDRPGARSIRVFTRLDNRLWTEDLWAKLVQLEATMPPSRAIT